MNITKEYLIRKEIGIKTLDNKLKTEILTKLQII